MLSLLWQLLPSENSGGESPNSGGQLSFGVRRRRVFTPKALHTIYKGWSRERTTLGQYARAPFTPKELHNDG